MKTISLTICALILIGGSLFVAPQSGAAATAAAVQATARTKQRPRTDTAIPPVGPLKLPLVRPKVVVVKSKRLLTLYSGGKLLRSYRVGLGFNAVDDKVAEGDGATPEGEFYIFTKNEKSDFYLSLGVSYPNVEDAVRGLRDGLISKTDYERIADAVRRRVAPPQDTALGGQIYIHGGGAHKDWTLGCVALENKDIKELFDALPVGTRVIIKH